MTVQVGNIIRNNDPRANGFQAVIERITAEGKACYWKRDSEGKKIGRINKVDLSRIYTDGQSRHQGWSLVTPAAQAKSE